MRGERLLPVLERKEGRALERLRLGPDRANSFTVDFVRSDELWDERRRLVHVSRRAVRVTVGLRDLAVRQAAAVSSPLKLTWAAIALVIGASAALLAWSASAPTPVQSGEVVEVELGPPSPIRPKVVTAPPAAPKPIAAPVVAPEAAAPAPVEAGPAPAAEAEAAAPDPLRVDALESVRAALGKAMQSGVAEAWSEKGLSGYVVPGPSALDGKAVCRNVAIWLDRPSGSGEVLDGRKCLAPDGSWVESEAPVAPKP